MDANKDKEILKVSVRELVEFILRYGDIDGSFFRANRALEGTRIHKKIQKAQNENYRAEVPIKYTVEYEEFNLSIEGRADGIIEDDGVVTVDEIKSTLTPLDLIDENYSPIHWAQAQLYGYIYGIKNNLGNIYIRLTYCHLETEEIKYLVKEFTISKLEGIFNCIVEKYYEWAKFLYKWQKTRNASIKTLQFPFSGYRKGQRELAVAVYKTITSSKNIFVKAPTGTGKTISAVFPSVKAVGEGKTSKIFYLTAKTITRGVAQEAFNLMRKCGLKFKTVTLTAKEKICFIEKVNCNPVDCKYAKGHFDRINQGLMDILFSEDEFNREMIEKYARKHTLCPFEFSLDIALWADCVIGDYNHVFDPRASLKRFFTEKGGDYTFLIDEAHNLVDRGREMYSCELYKKPFLQLKRDFKDINPKLSKDFGKVNKFMIGIKKLCNENGFYKTKEKFCEIYSILNKLISHCEEHFSKNENKTKYDELLSLYFEVLIFVKIYDLYDEKYITYVERSVDDIRLRLFCVDPSGLLKESLKKGRAGIFFSATLMPLDYYKGILGGEEGDYTMSIEYPFSVENREIMVQDRISTRYVNREKSYKDIAECINNLTSCKCGNYLIFFPSYKYMNTVYDVFKSMYPEVKAIIQEVSMSEEERENFLEVFCESPCCTTIGFCVMGGIFSEGIDLKSDRLIGSAIIGVGLPQVCPERDIIMEFFEKINGKGFEYAYMFPGMNKVMQGAGRVIRSENDRGVILLIDERFTNKNYLDLFPSEWFPFARVDKSEIKARVKNFWENKSLETGNADKGKK